MTKTAPIKRHESLKPLSREHHDGLLLCWKIRQGLNKKIAIGRIAGYARYFYTNRLIPHFETEERELFPILGREHPLVKQANEEHERLRHLFSLPQMSAEVLELIHQQLEKHIRFEERQLFQEIQEVANPEQLGKIEHLHVMVPGTDDWTDEFWK